MPRVDLAGEGVPAPGVPAAVEHPPVRLHPFGGHVVRRVHGAQREVQEERFAGRALLLVAHHSDGLVRQVLAEVVPLLGPAGGLGVVVVAHQVGRPVVGVPLEEPVVAFESHPEGPRVEGPGGRALPAWVRCHFPTARVEYPWSRRMRGSAAADLGSRAV